MLHISAGRLIPQALPGAPVCCFFLFKLTIVWPYQRERKNITSEIWKIFSSIFTFSNLIYGIQMICFILLSLSKVPKFMLFKLAFYFNLLAILKSISALYHLHVVIASPLHSHHSVQLLFHSTSLSNHSHHIHSNLSTKSMRFRTILRNFPLPFCLLHTTFISTPFVPTAIKLFFPRRFSLSAS